MVQEELVGGRIGKIHRMEDRVVRPGPVRPPVEVMCHGDFAPYNVTVVDGRAFGMIDFDTLHPGPRIWDVTYGVYRWCGLDAVDKEEIEVLVRRVKLFLDAYGATAEERQSLVEVLLERLGALVSFMREEASSGNVDFQRNIADGHLLVYLDDMAWLRAHGEAILRGI